MMSIAAIAFVAALGSAGGLHPLLRRIPPFEYFRSPLKLFALAEFTVAWTAALGADALWRMSHRRWRTVALVLSVAAITERAIYVAGEAEFFARVHARDGLSPDVFPALAGVRPARERRADAPPPVVFDLGGPVGGGCVRALNTLVGVASLHSGSVALLGRRQVDMLRTKPRSPALVRLLGAHYLLAPSKVCDSVAARFAWPVVETTADFCVVRNPDPVAHYELVTHATPVASDDEMIATCSSDPTDRSRSSRRRRRSRRSAPAASPSNAIARVGRRWSRSHRALRCCSYGTR
jgi:hypothetical protein